MKAAFSAALCVAVISFAAAGARAQVSAPSPAPATSPLPGAPKPGVAASALPSAEALDYDKFVKTAHKQDGLFPLYRVSGRVYMEVRDDQLDTDFLEHIVPANGLGGYGFHGGDQFTQSGRIVRFHEAGKSVVLIWPHTRFIAPPGTAIATAVHESTADSVETMLPIVTADKARKIRVVDVSPLLGDLLDLGTSLTQAVGADKNPEGTYRLDPTRTYFGPGKAFPENVIVEADETFTSAGIDGVDTVPDSRFVQMRVKYNFSKILSSPDYVPRLYDERVGYWEDPHAAFDRDDERDNLRWYVLRWDMAPSDPTQRLSPAKSPIVFYLDRSIPDQYRGAVRDGILEWNKPFERIGISNAVQVLDPPNDPAWDPDDIRYSVIRWVTDEPSEFGAEAQIVWDPRTGQIFRGGVLLDSNLGRNAKFGEKNLLDALTFPQADDAAPRSSHGNRYAPGHDESTFGRGEAAQAAFGATALAMMGETDKLDTFVYQRIKAVAMHEVGHDFGLSHNFIAHNAFSPEELKSAAFTKTHGTSSSVMDYWPVNIWPKGTSQGTYSPIALGPYDYHVIHWGYAAVPGAKTPQDEKPTLDRWAAASVDPKYAFAGDEDGDFVGGHAIDPRAAPFLLSNRPMDWCSTQLDMTKGFIATLDRRFPAPQEPWEDERVAFLSLLNRYTTCTMSLTHYIGGEYLSRNRVGDPGTHTALTPVPRAEEKRAFSMLDRYVFADANWHFSPTTLQRLVYTEYMGFGGAFGYDPSDRHDVPVVELVGGLQTRALASMFAPLVLQRLADMPTKAAPNSTMTLADLFAWTQYSVYGDLAAAKPSTQIRRNMQRTYARLLARLVVAPPPGTPLDAQALARVELAGVDSGARRALAKRGLDLQTRAHLAALQTDAERTLDAKIVLPLGGTSRTGAQ